MVTWDDFIKDPSCFETVVRRVFKENEKVIPYPIRCLAVSVNNFKPMHKLKLPTRKIDNVFQSVDSLVNKSDFKRK
jgi:hypothetical protein